MNRTNYSHELKLIQIQLLLKRTTCCGKRSFWTDQKTTTTYFMDAKYKQHGQRLHWTGVVPHHTILSNVNDSSFRFHSLSYQYDHHWWTINKSFQQGLNAIIVIIFHLSFDSVDNNNRNNNNNIGNVWTLYFKPYKKKCVLWN